MTRRDLLKTLGLGAGAAALTAASPRSARLLESTSAVAPDAPTMKFVRVAPVDGRRAAVLARLDDTHRVFGDGSREFLLRPGDEARLLQAGIRFDTVVEDVFADRRRSVSARVPDQPGQRDDYRQWVDMEADLRALAATHPDKARLLELPHRSLLGRRIYGIEIATDVHRRDGRPVIHHDGMHHAREWPAMEMPMMWAHDLLHNYGSDPDITFIVDNARTIIVPNNNPDGFIRSRNSTVQADSSSNGALMTPLGAAGRQSYWRKNLRSYSDVPHSLPEANQPYHYDNVDAHGVDLNRNYAFLWGDNLGASGLPEDQTYYGTAPFSEPEVRNIRDLFYAHLPIAAITHHTSGRIMLFAWGRDPNLVKSPDYDEMMFLGEDMGFSNGYQPKQAYGLYPTAGTSRDWGHYVCRSLIYTFEHGTEFHGPYESTIPSMYADNRGAFITHARRAIDPGSHLVLTGRVTDAGGRPVTASVTVTKSFSTPSAPREPLPEDRPRNSGPGTGGVVPKGDRIMTPETVTTTLHADADGSFTFHVPPSTRPHLFEEEFGGPVTEPYEVIVHAQGRAPVRFSVEGERGDAHDLGTIVLR